MKYTHIVWDFNGTLMDDVDIAVASVNDMLEKRDMPKTDKNTYLTQITSPIIEYYRKIFDLEKVPFEVITEEFLEGYMKRLGLAHLTKGAHDALDMFCSLGIKQCVISSFEQGRLADLQSLAHQHGLPLAHDLRTVLKARMACDSRIVISGSLYFVSEAVRLFQDGENKKKKSTAEAVQGRFTFPCSAACACLCCCGCARRSA